MGILKDRFKAKADQTSTDIKSIIKEHGNKKVGEVILSQIYQGMRGITGLVSETSLLDAQEGIRCLPNGRPAYRTLRPARIHPRVWREA